MKEIAKQYLKEMHSEMQAKNGKKRIEQEMISMIRDHLKALDPDFGDANVTIEVNKADYFEVNISANFRAGVDFTLEMKERE